MIVTQVFIAVAVSLFAATAQNPVDSPVTSGKENYEKMSSFDVPAAQNVNVREVADYDDDYYDEDADITKRDNEKQLKNTNVDNKAGNQARTDLERERRTGDTEAAENTNDTEGPITEEDIMAELGKLLSAKRSVDADEDEDYDDDDYVSRQKRDVDESYDENLDFDDVDDDLSMYKRDADDIDDDEEDEDDDDDEDDYEDDDVTKRKRGLDYDDDDDDDDDDYVTRKRRQDDDGDDDDDEEDDDVDEDDDEEVDDDDEDYDDYDYDEEIGKRDLGKEER